jgi:hypothetical protein
VNANVTVHRAVVAALLAAVLGSLFGAASAPAGQTGSPEPIVSVVRHGGLCVSGTECRSRLRITDSTVSADGYVPRRLKPGERLLLLRAIGKVELGYLRAHPFTGTCPIAYDGSESIYRLRGFARPLASCHFDLRGVAAVRLAERIFGSLRPKQR